MLPEARMKTRKNAQLHSLAGTRDKLVKQRTALINKIHNVLNSYGIKFKKESLCTEKGLKSALAFDWDTIVRIELEVPTDELAGDARVLVTHTDRPRTGERLADQRA